LGAVNHISFLTWFSLFVFVGRTIGETGACKY